MTTAKICYFTFSTIYEALRAEKNIIQKNLEFKMVPVPRRISSNCGTALRCLPENAAAIRAGLEEASVEVEGFYEIVESIPAERLSFLRKRKKGIQ